VREVRHGENRLRHLDGSMTDTPTNCALCLNQNFGQGHCHACGATWPVLSSQPPHVCPTNKPESNRKAEPCPFCEKPTCCYVLTDSHKKDAQIERLRKELIEAQIQRGKNALQASAYYSELEHSQRRERAYREVALSEWRHRHGYGLIVKTGNNSWSSAEHEVDAEMQKLLTQQEGKNE
jgi:hypothetical protein